MIFKITKKDKYTYFINPFFISLIIAIIIILASNFFYTKSFFVDIDIFLILMILPTLIIFIPLILFYFNYYKIDKNVTFKINTDQTEFSYINGNKTIEFKKEDVEKCILHLSIPVCHNRTIFAHWLVFSYAKIFTSRGNFVITCLTCDNIENYIPKEKIEKKCSHFSHAFPK